MDNILIISGNDSSINWPGSESYCITFFQSVDKVTTMQLQKADYLFTVDFENEEAVIELAVRLHKEQAFDAVVSFSEKTLLLASLIGEKLQVTHNPVDCVLKSRNKQLFRETLKGSIYELPVRSINTIEEAVPFLDIHGKIIIKPICGSGSYGVYELRRGDDISNITFDGTYVAEAYVEGQEFSVESLSLNGRHQVLGITKKYTTGTPNYIETGHDFPARLTKELNKKIATAVEELLNILGHRWGPAHTEIKVNEKYLHFIETQTRFGGDQIWEMVWKVKGINFAKATIDGMSGKVGHPTVPSYSEMAIRFFDVNCPTFSFERLSGLVKEKGVIRVQLHNARFGKKIHCSSDRHGYVFFGREETLSPEEFQQTLLNIEKL